MEDIFVAKRCNKITIHGRRAGETGYPPPDAAVLYRIADTRTQGFIGGQRLNSTSQVMARLG